MKYLVCVAALALTACGGSSAPTPAPASHAPPKSLHTSQVIVIGGNELFDHESPGAIRHDFGPCSTNEGIEDGDSLAMSGLFSLGILNDYPGAVILVANGFELTYTDRATTLDNFAGMVNNVQVSGSRAVVVGVPGADDFNAELRALALSRGVEFQTSLAAVKVCP